MSYHSLQDVIDSGDALDEGIEFFVARPKEFINLIKKNHKLALVFANTFKPKDIESMAKSCYGIFEHDKFFTMLLTIKTTDITLLDLTSENAVAERLFTIVANMMEKITTPKFLDNEFKDEAGTFETAVTNSVFPTLMKWPSLAMSRVLAVFLTNTSSKVAERELSAAKGLYFQCIIKYLPITKTAYDAAYAIFLGVANRGRSEFDTYVRKFNFGILSELNKKKTDENTDLAKQFFELGNLANKLPGQTNTLIDRFPSPDSSIHGSPEIRKPTRSASIPVPESRTNNNNNNSSSFLSNGYKASSLPSLQRRPSHPPPPVPNSTTTSETSPPPPGYYFPEQQKLDYLEQTVRRQSDEIEALKKQVNDLILQSQITEKPSSNQSKFF